MLKSIGVASDHSVRDIRICAQNYRIPHLAIFNQLFNMADHCHIFLFVIGQFWSKCGCARKVLHHVIGCHSLSCKICANSFGPALFQQNYPQLIPDWSREHRCISVTVTWDQIINSEVSDLSMDEHTDHVETYVDVRVYEKILNIGGSSTHGGQCG